MLHHERNPEYIHHQKNLLRTGLVREVVFGLEDGMVSTMGAVTGIAIGAQDHYLVLLSGLVIIAVESISMAVGSYLSNKSEKEIDERKLHEERTELKQFPKEEKMELVGMYVKDGWTKKLAFEMAEEASQNKKLFLQEMAYRELKIIPDNVSVPWQNGVAMGIAYVVGGSISLSPYIFMAQVNSAIPLSIGITLAGLFVLGALTTKFSKRSWWKAGLEMFSLATMAALVGYLVGRAAETWFKN